MPVKASRVDLFNQLSRCFENYEADHPRCFPCLSECTDIIVASDDSGGHQAADFSAFSFLIFDWNASEKWSVLSSNVRERFLAHGNQEMGYKKLPNKNKNRALGKQRALVPFLEAADCINGMAITFLVSKRVGSVLEPGGVEYLQKIAPALAGWKLGTIEKLYRVQTFLAFLLAGLCRPGQRTYWLTDDDEIAANSKRVVAAAEMLRNFSRSHFARDILLGSVDTVNSVDAKIAGPTKDLASIPDLIGGALVEAWSASSKNGFSSNSTSKPVALSQAIPEKAKLIIKWFMQDDKPLRRHVATIDMSENDPTSLHFNWLKFADAVPSV